MQKLIFINGNGKSINLTEMPFGIINWNGLANTELNVQGQQVPFQDGSVFLDALLDDRTIELTLSMCDNNDLNLRYELRRALISALNPKLGEGTLIYTNDYLSKQIKAIPEIPLFENHNSNDSGTPKVGISFICCNPYWEDVEETNIMIDGNEIIENEGDVPCPMKIELMCDNAVNPSVINITTHKKIELEGTFNGNILIDTNTGNKTIKKGSLKWNVLGGGNTVRKIVFSVNLLCYIGVGTGNLLYKSLDGIRWDIVNTGIEENFFDILINEEKIYITCTNGIILKTTDLISFTEIDTLTGQNIISIIYVKSLNKYFVASRGSFLESSDGNTFTVIATGYYFLKVIYSEYYNKFIALNTNSVCISSDGVTWTSQSFSSRLTDVAINDEAGIVNMTCEASKTFRSSDLVLWDEIPAPIAYNIGQYIAYSPVAKLFCLTTLSLMGQGFYIWVSPDGLNWYSQEIPISGFCNYISNLNKFFIYNSVSKILISENGFYWEYLVNKISGTYNDIHYSENLKKYIVVGTDIATSTDGKDFEVKKTLSSDAKAIAEGAGVLIVINGTHILKSSDGNDWQEVANISGLNDVTYSERVGFIAVGDNGQVYISENGTVWNDISINEEDAENINGIAISNNFIYAIGNNGTMYYKNYSALSWSSKEFAVSNMNKAIIVEQTNSCILYICCDEGKIIKYNEEYNNPFTIIDTGMTENLLNIFYSDFEKTIYVCGEDGKLLISLNGINWNELKSGTENDIYSVYYDKLNNAVYTLGYSIEYSTTEEGENIIANLTAESNLDFNLEQGENNLFINKESGSIVAMVRFRNKYIGV